MALSINNALLDLSKIKPLEGTNYKHCSQMLLIFVEELEVEHALFCNPPEEKNASETFVAFPNGKIKDKSKAADEATLKNSRKSIKRSICL